MIRRTITIKMMEEFQPFYNENKKNVWEAINYASMWGFEGYTVVVNIWCNHRGEIEANYLDESNKQVFFMCGVMNEDKTYLFHS